MKTQKPSTRHWSRRDAILLLEKLELYISSGLSVNDSLDIISRSMKRSHKRDISLVQQLVMGGSSLSSSLSRSIGLSPLIVGLIGHGEESGGLVQSLLLSRSLIEQQGEIRSKIISALLYPSVIGLFAIVLTIGLVRGVVPQIVPMLKGLHVDLPILTQVVIVLSDCLTEYGHLIITGIACSCMVIFVSYRSIRAFRAIVHASILRMPLIGRIARGYGLSLFLRSCGVLIDCGVSAVQAYSKSSVVVPVIPISHRLVVRIDDISRGIPISAAVQAVMRGMEYVPALLQAGEASGSLGRSMIRAADIIDRDIDRLLKRSVSLIEPLMMACMGIVVGAIALSIMMPIYDISKALQR